MDFYQSIEQFLSKKTQQQKIRQHYAAIARRGGTGGVAVAQQEALQYAEEAKRFIIASLPESLKSGSARPITESDLEVGPVEITETGDFRVKMWWNPDAVRRKSLYEDSEDGIDDIVRLFSNGYHARAYVYGWWDGHKGSYGPFMFENFTWARSRIARDPLPFLEAAVAAYNSAYKKDKVKLSIADGYLTH